MGYLKICVSGCAGWSRAKSLPAPVPSLATQTAAATRTLCLISSDAGLLSSSRTGENVIELNLQQQTFTWQNGNILPGKIT